MTEEMKAQMIEAVEQAGVYDWLYSEYPGTEAFAEKIRNFEY